jgi:hypothetical protein
MSRLTYLAHLARFPVLRYSRTIQVRSVPVLGNRTNCIQLCKPLNFALCSQPFALASRRKI